MTHTKTPWTAQPCDNAAEYEIKAGEYDIADIFDGADSVSAKANAAFIVRACNAHDDLVKALQLFVQYDSNENDGIDCMLLYADAIKAARIALAKVSA